MPLNLKLIAFDVKTDREAEEVAGRELLERLKSNPDDPNLISDLRAIGYPAARVLIPRMIQSGAAEAYLEERFAVAAPLDLGMLDVPGENFRFMAGKVTRELFRQFAKEEKYTPTGDRFERLLEIIKSEDDPLSDIVFVNMDDARAFIAWVKKKTGKMLRLPTKEEWSTAVRTLRSQLIRCNSNFEWTSTDTDDGLAKVLCSVGIESCLSGNPESRYFRGLRLVEDL